MYSNGFIYSCFEVLKTQTLPKDSLWITGDLNIKDVTKSIAFKTLYTSEAFSARLTFDRFQWNVGYKGSWLDRTLIDKDITLSILLKIK